MKVRREQSHRALLVPVLLILAAAFLATSLSVGRTSNEISGAQTVSIRGAPLGSGCDYFTEDPSGTGIDIFILNNPGKDGDDYCKSIGYKTAGFVTEIVESTYYSSTDNSCTGLGQLEDRYEQVLSGDQSLTLGGNICGTQTTNFAEPAFGDVFVTRLPMGAYCCK